jgi:hypothetical protein
MTTRRKVRRKKVRRKKVRRKGWKTMRATEHSLPSL